MGIVTALAGMRLGIKRGSHGPGPTLVSASSSVSALTAYILPRKKVTARSVHSIVEC